MGLTEPLRWKTGAKQHALLVEAVGEYMESVFRRLKVKQPQMTMDSHLLIDIRFATEKNV